MKGLKQIDYMTFLPLFGRQIRFLQSRSPCPDVVGSLRNSQFLATLFSPPATSESAWQTATQVTWKRLQIALGISFFSSSTSIAGVLIAKSLLDSTEDILAQLTKITSFFFLNVTAAVLNYVGLVNRGHLSNLVSANLASRIFRAISFESAGRTDAGKIRTLLSSDAEDIGTFLSESARTVIPGVISTLLMVPVMIWLVGWPGLAAGAATLLIFPISWATLRLIGPQQKRQRLAEERYSAAVSNWINDRISYKLSGLDRAMEAPLVGRLTAFISAASQVTVTSLGSYACSVTWWVVPVVVILIGMAGSGPEARSSFFASLWLVTTLVRYLVGLPSAVMLFGRARVAARRIDNFIQAQIVATPLPPQSPGLFTHLVCQDLTLVMGQDAVFEHLHCKIPLQSSTAIIGAAGTGKSLLLQLLIGAQQPTSGRVLLLDTQERAWNLSAPGVRQQLWSQINFSGQTPFIIDAPATENVLLHEPRGDDLERFKAALSQVDRLEEIQDREADLAAGGHSVSGGQARRLALARVFLTPERTAVLDSPFTGLDRLTAEVISERILARSAGVIAVVNEPALAAAFHQIIDLDELPGSSRESP